MVTNTDALTIADASADAATETSESISTTSEYKYAQLEVPSFQYDASGSSFDCTIADSSGTETASGSYSSTASSDTTKTTSGNSFVRLGSFPTITATTAVTANDDGTKTMTTTATAGSDAPAGFLNSLDLAVLVGEAAHIDATVGSDEHPGSSGIVRESEYVGDAYYLLGFTDDTRARVVDATGAVDEKTYIDGVQVDNDAATRQAETKRLLTKGGWWDHSDGNRVSTTAGDKVEVIQGNYKMVILGRQDPTAFDIGKTAITDFSGGHFQEQYTSPTPAIKSVGWVKEDEGWALIQDNGAGSVTTKFHGKQVDYFTGTKKESITGLDPSDTDGTSATHDPSLLSKTWAQKIESYTGSSGKPVPHMYSETWAGKKEDLTFAESVVAMTNAVSIVSTNTAAVDIVSVNTAASIWTLNTALVSTQVDLIPQTFGYKLGSDQKFGLSKTGVWLNDTDLTVKKDELAATHNRLMGTMNLLAGSVLRLQGRRTSLAGQDVEISQARVSISSVHSEM
jgi:hypothetical protein